MFGLSSVCVRMHVRVRMCLRAWACDVIGMVVSGVGVAVSLVGSRFRQIEGSGHGENGGS